MQHITGGSRNLEWSRKSRRWLFHGAGSSFPSATTSSHLATVPKEALPPSSPPHSHNLTLHSLFSSPHDRTAAYPGVRDLLPTPSGHQTQFVTIHLRDQDDLQSYHAIEEIKQIFQARKRAGSSQSDISQVSQRPPPSKRLSVDVQ